MGDSVSYKCPKCGYSFIGPLGSGFLYPEVYYETVEKMKSGEFGKKAKQFFKNPFLHSVGEEPIEIHIMECICKLSA